MNLGIVIAVSDYGSAGNNLPGCKADGYAIAKILKTDNKFDDVLYLSEKTGSGDVKPELVKFINSHKHNEIEDVVFYFTGHGDFNGDEFYFLLSDYDRKRRKQTSIENTELDNLIKTLNPTNAIKIVDACHSGTPYIKDPDAFDTYLKGTQREFKKCYFLFSSQTDQYSYQDEKLSFFTKSIVEAVQNHKSEIIRYKDVIDYVSDSFSDNHNQTPFFIVQADFTESFCTVTETLRKALKDVLVHQTADLDPKLIAGDSQKSLLDLVREDAQKYCTEEEALNHLAKFFASLRDAPLSKEISDLYEVQYESVGEYAEIPSALDIGKWLDSNDHKFFAHPYKEEVKIRRRVPKDPRKRILGSLANIALLGINEDDEDEFKTIISTELRIKGFRSTIDMPTKLLKITINPKFPNIDAASAYIVPIISKTEMRVFFSFNFYDQQDWSGRKISDKVKWLTELVGIKDEEARLKIGQKIMADFSSFVYTPIAEKFKLVNKNETAADQEFDEDL